METHLNKKKEDWQKLQNGEKSLITTETKNSDGQNPKDKKQDHKSRENIEKTVTEEEGNLWEFGHFRTRNRRAEGR